VDARIAAEGQLTQALSRLMVVTESYPDLKANQNFLGLQEELTSTENKIGFARQAYNDAAMTYNTKIETFPSNLVAGISASKAGTPVPGDRTKKQRERLSEVLRDPMREAIESNRRRSRILVSGMGCCWSSWRGHRPRRPPRRAARADRRAIGRAAWSGPSSGSSPSSRATRIMLSVAGAEKIEKAAAPQLFNVVEEMVIAHPGSAKCPDIYGHTRRPPNAVRGGAEGRDAGWSGDLWAAAAAIRDELQGVIAARDRPPQERRPGADDPDGRDAGRDRAARPRSSSADFLPGAAPSSKGQQRAGVAIAVSRSCCDPRRSSRGCSTSPARGGGKYLADASAARFTRYPEGWPRRSRRSPCQFQGGSGEQRCSRRCSSSIR
jgi:hypothetical protein